jgi:hypothetical protein
MFLRGSDQLQKIPIFLTSRGTAMPAQLFRDHYWRPALRKAGIDADPHAARHWFVTNAPSVEAYGFPPEGHCIALFMQRSISLPKYNRSGLDTDRHRRDTTRRFVLPEACCAL